jgi:hypothetical protein
MHEPGGTETQMAAWKDSPSFASNRWTDVWLGAVAFCAGARLVSFDKDFRTFPSLSFYHLGVGCVTTGSR